MADGIFILDLSFAYQKSKYGEESQVLFRHTEFVIFQHITVEISWSHWKHGPGELMAVLKQPTGMHWNENGSTLYSSRILGEKIPHEIPPKRFIIC